MSKLKDHIIKQEEHSRILREALRKSLNERYEATLRYNSSKHQSEEFLYKPNDTMQVWQAPISVHKHNTLKHQSTQTWSADMPDLEGEALADAEKQFDYDSWMGEHGIGE